MVECTHFSPTGHRAAVNSQGGVQPESEHQSVTACWSGPQLPFSEEAVVLTERAVVLTERAEVLAARIWQNVV